MINRKMTKVYILYATLPMILITVTGGEPTSPDIKLVPFGDLVQLARDRKEPSKRPGVTRTREDKSFAELDLLGQGQLGLPTQANVFEHFKPKPDKHFKQTSQENFQELRYERLQENRESKQRFSFNLNNGVRFDTSSIPASTQFIVPQNIFTSSPPQPQQTQYLTSDQSRNKQKQEFRVGDVSVRDREKENDPVVFDYDDLFDQIDNFQFVNNDFNDYQTVTVNSAKKVIEGKEVTISENNVKKNIKQEVVEPFNYYDVLEIDEENNDFDDNVYETISIQSSTEATNEVKYKPTKEITHPRNGIRKVLRKKPTSRNKARAPTRRKTLNIPIFVPDLSYINSLYNPNRARKPAQKKQKTTPILKEVAEAKERCIDKIEEVEEIVYDEVEECDHSYDKKCHTSYATEYESQQQEECNDNFNKKCEITYEDKAKNETVEVCMNPLVKNCDLSGPEVCKTEYITECFTLNNAKIIVDDVPSCETVYDEKCETKQTGYTSELECKSWPKQVCTVSQQIKKKFAPEAKCEKAPQEICAPRGCSLVPGPEVCHDKVMTIVTSVPLETCYLDPVRSCELVTKIVPLLTPVEECVDVPKEICQKKKGNPRKVVKPVTKKWCYTPTQESGLV